MNKLEKLPILNFRHFCYTLGVVPTSYLDTMTDLELKLWLIKFLCEQVIPVVNNNSETVKELQELFLKLQNYVNDYFENLDVQEEINNKLDDMAKSGELGELIGKYINNNLIRIYKNVDEMINDNGLEPDMKCKTLGYYTENDTGGNYYLITETDNNLDNEIYVNLNNGYYAKLIIENHLSPCQLGCYGDGMHDDTDIFQKTIDFCETNNIKITACQQNTFLISKTLVINNYNININLNNAKILCSKDFTNNADYNSIIYVNVENIGAIPNTKLKNIGNFTLDCNYIDISIALRIKYLERAFLDKINIINCYNRAISLERRI